jgi:DNA-(apurinic or apyrimidinic site) lyase (EC 4.2.99.18)/endonuclease III (EC 3.2.2.-)
VRCEVRERRAIQPPDFRTSDEKAQKSDIVGWKVALLTSPDGKSVYRRWRCALFGVLPVPRKPAAISSEDIDKPIPPTRPLNPAEIEELFAIFQKANPEPKGELHAVNPYTLLVAVTLSAQTTDAGVNRATRPLFETVDTPQKMVELGEDRLREAIKTIGLYRNKAKNVIALSEILVREHGGEVPRDRAALEALPGVGRKTANVVLNIAFGEPTIAVDTHLPRLKQAGPRAWADADRG